MSQPSNSAALKQPRKRSSLSDSVAHHSLSSRRCDVTSTFAFGGLAVLPPVRRTSRERLSTIVSQDGEERELAKVARKNTDASVLADDEEEDVPRRVSSSRAQLHPSTRHHRPSNACYSRQSNLAASSPVLGRGYWTPPALLRPSSSYRQLRQYFIERQRICFNNLHLLPAAPEGGWGWWIVIAAFFTNFFFEGIAFSFAPILIHLTSEAPHMVLHILLMNATLIATYLIVCPIAMSFINAFGCRRVLLIGAVIASIGFILSYVIYADSTGAPLPPGEALLEDCSAANSSLPADYNLLIVCYGAVTGVGFGFIKLAAIVGVAQYFELNRALPMGVALCGGGFGVLVLPPCLSYAMDRWGFDCVAAILAGLTLNCCCTALLFRPLTPTTEPQRRPKPRPNPPVRAASCSEATATETGRNVRLRHVSLGSNDSSASSSRNELLAENNTDSGVDTSKANETPVNINTEDPGEPDPQDSITKLKMELAVVLPPPAIAAAARSDRILNRPPARPQMLLTAKNRRFQVVKQPLSPRHNPVSLADLARPFYRIDVLYGRSVTHLPRCRSEVQMADYRASAFQVPEDTLSPCSAASLSDQEQRSAANTSTNSLKRGLVLLFPKPMLDPIRQTYRDTRALLRDSAFLRIALGSALCMMAVPLPYFVLPWWSLALRPGRPSEYTTSPFLASCLLSVIGGSSIAGRFLSGFVADLPNGPNVLFLHNMAIFVITFATFMLQLINQFAALGVYAGIFGFCYAFHTAFSCIVLGETVGVERLTPAYNIVSVFRGLALFVSIPLMKYFLGDPTYCVSDKGQGDPANCSPLPANSMPRAVGWKDPNRWWARVPHPPLPGPETMATLATNGYRIVILLSGMFFLTASILFATLHFRPGATTARSRTSSRRSSNRHVNGLITEGV